MGYTVGQKVTIYCRFTRERLVGDPPGTPERVPMNPTTVTATVEKPDGVEVNASGSVSQLADPETGAAAGYYAGQVIADRPGRWRYRFAGSDPVMAPDEGSFFVERSFVDSLNG